MASLIWADHRGLLLHDGVDMWRYDGQVFSVRRVINIHTFEIDAPDGQADRTRVRLAGLESWGRYGDGDADALKARSEEGTNWIRRFIEGRPVRLRLDPDRVRDRSGHLLAWVELPDGTMLHEQLLIDGRVRLESRFVHPRRDRLGLLQMQAQLDGVGLWAPEL